MQCRVEERVTHVARPQNAQQKEASILLMEKDAGAQQCTGHASERHSIGGKRMENQKGDSNVCGV